MKIIPFPTLFPSPLPPAPSTLPPLSSRGPCLTHDHTPTNPPPPRLFGMVNTHAPKTRQRHKAQHTDDRPTRAERVEGDLGRWGECWTHVTCRFFFVSPPPAAAPSPGRDFRGNGRGWVHPFSPRPRTGEVCRFGFHLPSPPPSLGPGRPFKPPL